MTTFMRWISVDDGNITMIAKYDESITSTKVCEDTSGPEECIEPPDAVTFGFKNRFSTIKSSQLN